MADNLLTIQQVMERLRLGRSTIYRLIDAGKLRPVKIGKALRFREQDIQAFIASLGTQDGVES